MKTFADTINLLNIARIQKTNTFRRNKKGIMQKTIEVSVSLIKGERNIDLGLGFLCYADIDLSEDSTEAELVQKGLWKRESVGRMWVYINGMTYHLAKISPMGIDTLIGGFVAENGKVTIKEGEKDVKAAI